jgi:6-phosphogluconolactonase
MKGYIGTYTETAYKGRGKGIYGFSFDEKRGTIEDLFLAAETVNPSYLVPGPRFLYAVNELQDFGGRSSGAVSAFAVEEGGALRLINRQPSEGADPCHIVLDDTGRWVVVSNYSGGTLAALPVEVSGGLAPAAQVLRLTGGGPNRERQEAAHAHSFVFAPNRDRGFACDLGSDRVMAYAFNPDAGIPLTDAPVPWFAAKPGAGPRHGLFAASAHGEVRYYLINELDSTLDVLRYDGDRGSFTAAQNLSTLPPEAGGGNTGAAIKLSPAGQWLYVSNRGHDSITFFQIDARGAARYAGTVSSGGRTPRDFDIDPTGGFLLVCHQDSDNLVVFRLDPETGHPRREREYAVPSPVCLKFCP